MTPKGFAVAIIDDDYDDFLMIRDLLTDVEGTEYQTQWISNSAKALEVLRQQSADVYLIDYRLDAKTGLDVLEELGKENLKKPVIFLTAQGDRAIDLAAMKKGAADYLSKLNLTSDVLERSIRYSTKRMQDQEQLKETQKLKVAKEAAELANRAKSEFLAHMSHEIRTPLAAILGFAELSLESETSEAEKIEYITIIKRSAGQLLELLNHTLEISKIESGNIHISPRTFFWRPLVYEVMELLNPKVTAKGITLNCQINSKIPAALRSDPLRFRQILTNLIGNAVKFTDHGEINIVCDVIFNAASPLGELSIKIKDTGIGMSLEEQTRLFQPYEQASRQSGLKYGGTGLGLDISKKLARAVGGELLLSRSEKGIGSEFSWTLSRCFVTESQSAAKTNSATTKIRNLAGLNSTLKRAAL
jgi:signal transduction histidine kinase